MPSMTLMISTMRCELSSMACMVCTTAPTMSPPLRATPEAWSAS
jgi:hypothetical protein